MAALQGLPAAALAAQGANCDFSAIPQAVWYGSERRMTLQQLAEYAAPVFWFSPDEPSNARAQGKAMKVPKALPFEVQPDGPVVYYQYNTILQANTDSMDGPAFVRDSLDVGNSIIDLHNISGLNLKYIAYFRTDWGLGAHPHDVEPTEFVIWVGRNTSQGLNLVPCDRSMYVVGVARVSAEAHGLVWSFNVLNVDETTVFPFHLLVEEGKHGMATDKNGDGYYTPGYDVNVRPNDAWGLRDIMSGGDLFAGEFKAWMAKVRRPEHRVLPPLPEGSPFYQKYVETSDMGIATFAPHNAVYQLRPFPPSTLAGSDERLRVKMAEKERVAWPEVDELTGANEFARWWASGVEQKSYALSARLGGDRGLSFVFPMFVIANLEAPLVGGWLVNRVYLKDRRLRDFGWMVMYMPSASRWLDTYMAAGAELDRRSVDPLDPKGPTTGGWDFVYEAGLKLRVNITKTPLKFLAGLPLLDTDFWGFRAGIKNRGIVDITQLTYVFEFGAGVW